MKTIVKQDLLILSPDTADERAALGRWKHGREGHVLAVVHNSGAGISIQFLGRREDICREPVNVTARHPDPSVRLIGNLAATPFDLDGRRYASVESFWQSLKFPDGPDRDRLAALDGPAARAAAAAEFGPHVRHDGRDLPVGTWQHWQLMERACRAKFEQNPEAQAALLATGDRPLTHRVRRADPAIPGIILADIWMRLRKELRLQLPGALPGPEEPDEDE